MLAHPTQERLIALGLTGMVKALEEQRRSPDIAALGFEERLGLLVDREHAERDSKRVAARLKAAALRHDACIEDADLRAPRGLDRALFLRIPMMSAACSGAMSATGSKIMSAGRSE